jgi:hypothetical protein
MAGFLIGNDGNTPVIFNLQGTITGFAGSGGSATIYLDGLANNGGIIFDNLTNTRLYRDNATGILACYKTGGSATFRVYNTTDSSVPPFTNLEVGVFDWTTNLNILSIGTQRGGTGVSRPVRLIAANANNNNCPVFNFGVAPNTQTGTTYTIVDGDQWIISNNVGVVTLTLPTAANYTGRELIVKTINTGTVISASSNVVPRATNTAGTAILSGTAGSWAWMVSDGSNWVIMAGA